MSECCAACGKNLALVGRVHHCSPKPNAKTAKAIAELDRGEGRKFGTVEELMNDLNRDVTNAATNAPKMSPVERSLKWRSENPERYKETQRNLMRKKRAKSNAPA